MALVTPGTFSQAALTAELTNDPKQLGYASLTDSPDDIAGAVAGGLSTDRRLLRF